MAKERNLITKVLEKLKGECIRDSLDGIYIAMTSKLGLVDAKLEGKFFFFTSVDGAGGRKGLLIGEKQGESFEDMQPLVVMFDDPTVDSVAYDPFPENYLDPPLLNELVYQLNNYLDRTIDPEKLTVRNTKKIAPFLMPESKTLH